MLLHTIYLIFLFKVSNHHGGNFSIIFKLKDCGGLAGVFPRFSTSGLDSRELMSFPFCSLIPLQRGLLPPSPFFFPFFFFLFCAEKPSEDLSMISHGLLSLSLSLFLPFSLSGTVTSRYDSLPDLVKR